MYGGGGCWDRWIGAIRRLLLKESCTRGLKRRSNQKDGMEILYRLEEGMGWGDTLNSQAIVLLKEKFDEIRLPNDTLRRGKRRSTFSYKLFIMRLDNLFLCLCLAAHKITIRGAVVCSL